MLQKEIFAAVDAGKTETEKSKVVASKSKRIREKNIRKKKI